MTYAQLVEKVLGTATTPGQAFPLGVPENLVQQAKDLLLEALIEVQRCVECYQVGHVDVHPASSLIFQNGTSVLSAPQGQIERVYTILNANGGWNQPIPYNPRELGDLRRWMGRFRQTWQWLGQPPPQDALYLQEGFTNPTSIPDSPAGRALMGMFALDKFSKRLIIAPWLQSTESLVLEWTGIKRTWLDTDLVPDDPDFVRLIKHWVVQEYGRIWAAADLEVRVDTWRGALADAIVTCQEISRLDVRPRGEDEVDAVRLAYACTPPGPPPDPVGSTTRICMVGDTGTTEETAIAVAEHLLAQNPALVVLLGDTVYQPHSIEDGLAPYEPAREAKKLIVALGNHDLDHGLTAVAEFIPNPGNGRYFSIASGPVEIFVIDVGLNTTGDLIEPDGNFAGSPQWSVIRNTIARSCARWKFAVLHHSPYTSGERYVPGLQVIRWASDLLVHAVISAHSHNYERGSWRGRPHLIVGSGGAPLDSFVTPSIDGSLVRKKTHGYLAINADQTQATLEFIEVPSGEVLDSIVITGEPPIPSTDPQPPAPDTVVVYYGRSAKSANYTEADILSWPAVSKTTRFGEYIFPAGPGYCCFAFPLSLGMPTDQGDGKGFLLGKMPAAMGRPDGTPPYGHFDNGYGVELVNVEGEIYRVYRTYYIPNGQIKLTVN